MPTYEYECKSCGEHIEARQSFTDLALTDCPTCGGPLRKVFGNISISFKGSGFYRTDSRGGARTKDKEKDKDKEATKAPVSSDAKSSKSDSSKSDSSKSDSSKSDSSPPSGEASKPSSSDDKGSGSDSSAPPKAAAATG